MVKTVPRSLISFKNFNESQVFSIIQTALENKKNNKAIDAKIRGTAALLFFEPSTRTRFSFQTACVRAGVSPLIMDGANGTSLEKGESIEDTIFNLEAMRPLFFVIRCGDEVSLDEISSHIKSPIINAGWGKQGHPTQALLDVATMFERWNDLRGKKILFVGDVRHSRVFASHVELSKILGYSISYCAPAEFSLSAANSDLTDIKKIDQLEQALDWADAVVTLRVQKERHTQNAASLAADYNNKYGLSKERAKLLKPQGLILHPGPINYGVEINQDILSDSRSVIMPMVENGVFVREAVIEKIISGELG